MYSHFGRDKQTTTTTRNNTIVVFVVALIISFGEEHHIIRFRIVHSVLVCISKQLRKRRKCDAKCYVIEQANLPALMRSIIKVKNTHNELYRRCWACTAPTMRSVTYLIGLCVYAKRYNQVCSHFVFNGVTSIFHFTWGSSLSISIRTVFVFCLKCMWRFVHTTIMGISHIVSSYLVGASSVKMSAKST